jgi:hypothetical protein
VSSLVVLTGRGSGDKELHNYASPYTYNTCLITLMEIH